LLLVLNELYSERILAAAGAIPPARRLAESDASAVKTSRVCGSQVAVDLVMKDDCIADFGMEAKACALGQASASIVARAIIGARPATLYRLRDAMRAMLKENGPPPHEDPLIGDKWRELETLSVIRDYPQRHASTMLVFEAVAACLDALGYGAPAASRT
jgi:NifU-like protein involved in Fe-S cluster formation